MREKFRELDVDGSGSLDFSELAHFMKILNPSFSAPQLQQLFSQMDSNDNGVVELDEFIDYVVLGKRRAPAVAKESPQGKPDASGVRQQWKNDTLAGHNHFREMHGSPDLVWSDECYISAKIQADACQQKGGMFHGTLEGPSGRHGQNIYWCSAPGSSAYHCIECWYDEVIDPGYDFSDPGFSYGTGHFTQVVWKSSTAVGMAVSEDGKFVVANYFPAGNFMGHFPENVPRNIRPYDKLTEENSSPNKKDNRRKSIANALGSIKERHNAAPTKTSGKEITADRLTPELSSLFDDCPFPFLDKVKTALAAGGIVKVSVSEDSGTTELKIEIKQGRCTSRIAGSWGGG